MSGTVFLRLLHESKKETSLAYAIESYRRGQTDSRLYFAEPCSFEKVPGSPFAYWLSAKVLQLFQDLPTLEGNGRTVRVGDHPGDGFQYLRIFWEIPIPSRLDWRNYQKGGDYSPFYYDIHLVADWDADRQTYRGFRGRPGRLNERPSNYQCFFQQGLTWARRSQRGLSVRALPEGCIFADKGPVVFGDPGHLLALLSLMNSLAFKGLVSLQMAFGSYETGVMQRTVVPNLSEAEEKQLTELAKAIIRLKMLEDTANETSHAFSLPALLQIPADIVSNSINAWFTKASKWHDSIAQSQKEIDELSFQLYCIGTEDRRAIEESLGTLSSAEGTTERTSKKIDFEDDEEIEVLADSAKLLFEVLSYTLGAVLGRWDVRYATGQRQLTELPDPFAPLPVCSPGMLQGTDGLSLTETPEGYPLLIDWDGILVDDPDHQDDIIRRIRDVLELIWKDRADAIEKEACEILGVKDLRDYFRKPGKSGFWDDHVKRYSKSRRKAPIYWLLQSSKKNYALWLYYHRLDKDILFKALLNYVEPKIRLEQSRLEPLRAQRVEVGTSGREAKKLEKDIDRQEELISELRDFEDKLRQVANLHLDPDLNDGVVLNIAPLRELVPWKEAKKYWDELLAGKYEWSSIGKQLRERSLVHGH